MEKCEKEKLTLTQIQSSFPQKNGSISLSDDVPGLGLTIKEKALSTFEVIEEKDPAKPGAAKAQAVAKDKN